MPGFFKLLILPQHRPNLEIRNIIIGIDGQFGFELFHRFIGIASHLQSLRVENVCFGKIRIKGHSLGELVPRSGKIGSAHLRAAQHQMTFRRFAVAQNTIHQHLPLGHLMVADQRGSEQIGNGQIIRDELRSAGCKMRITSLFWPMRK